MTEKISKNHTLVKSFIEAVPDLIFLGHYSVHRDEKGRLSFSRSKSEHNIAYSYKYTNWVMVLLRDKVVCFNKSNRKEYTTAEIKDVEKCEELIDSFLDNAINRVRKASTKKRKINIPRRIGRIEKLLERRYGYKYKGIRSLKVLYYGKRIKTCIVRVWEKADDQASIGGANILFFRFRNNETQQKIKISLGDYESIRNFLMCTYENKEAPVKDVPFYNPHGISIVSRTREEKLVYARRRKRIKEQEIAMEKHQEMLAEQEANKIKAYKKSKQADLDRWKYYR